MNQKLESPVRIMVICQAFRFELVLVRWKLLVERYSDVEIMVVGPNYWESCDFGKTDVYPGLPEREEGRFRFVTVNMCRNLFRGGWYDRKMLSLVKEFRPNIIYLIGEEGTNVLFQMALARKLYVPEAKIIAFTMREIPFPFQNPHFRLRWSLATKIIDAYLCHHPKGVERLRGDGRFKKPIYMQTQVGVDAQIFRPDPVARKKIREKWGIGEEEFVFGTLSRLDVQKGILDVVNAVNPHLKYKVMVIGDGVDSEKVREQIDKKGLNDQVLLPGRVPCYGPVAEFLNGLDALVHVPCTTPNWIDTFPLAVVQAMAVGLPVIGSDSGAVPYQLGPGAMIVPEANPSALKVAMDEMFKMSHEERSKYGEQLRRRVLNTFEISHLTDCFYVIMKDILANRYVAAHADQQDFQF
jgi:glycosyltransferase involved in cell wall biosynthesis